MKYFKSSATILVRLMRGGPRLASRLSVPALIAIGALLAVSSFGTHSAQAAGAQLKVHAVDFSFQADSAASSGPVHLEFFNDSKDYTHEVKIFRADQQAKLDEFLAQRRAGHDVDEADFFTVAGGVEDVPAGQSIAVDVDLPAGQYILACFVQSPIAGTDTVHYDLGMHSTLTVGDSTSPAVAPAQVSAPAPAAAAAATNLQAPKTGSGPSSAGSSNPWIMGIAGAGALLLASGELVRRAARRR